MRQYKILLVGILIFGNVACLQTRSQVQAQEEKKVIQDQVKNLQVNRADTQVKIQEVSQEVLQVNGRVESVESKTANLERGLKERSKSTDQQLAEMSNRMKTIEDAALAMNQRLDSVNSELQQLKAAKAEAKSSSEGKGPEKGPFVTAEEEYSKGKWGEAILSYMKYRDQNPKGKRFAEATYKIGYSFQQLGKGAQAKSFYQEVIERFPGTSHAKKAHSQLQKLEK